jgi:hypothetical protein
LGGKDVSLADATSVFRRRLILFVSKYLLPLQEPLSLVIGFAFGFFSRAFAVLFSRATSRQPERSGVAHARAASYHHVQNFRGLFSSACFQK